MERRAAAASASARDRSWKRTIRDRPSLPAATGRAEWEDQGFPDLYKPGFVSGTLKKRGQPCPRGHAQCAAGFSAFVCFFARSGSGVLSNNSPTIIAGPKQIATPIG